jgi:hypothetical protein
MDQLKTITFSDLNNQLFFVDKIESNSYSEDNLLIFLKANLKSDEEEASYTYVNFCFSFGELLFLIRIGT